uniref:Putative secreted protein n=1 Tax=Ixodes ricinus TaxID=34613 RepID=A0A6B0UP41_IXORI
MLVHAIDGLLHSVLLVLMPALGGGSRTNPIKAEVLTMLGNCVLDTEVLLQDGVDVVVVRGRAFREMVAHAVVGGLEFVKFSRICRCGATVRVIFSGQPNERILELLEAAVLLETQKAVASLQA